MVAVPLITRNRIETIAAETQMTVRNPKEKQFWKAIYLGCKVN